MQNLLSYVDSPVHRTVKYRQDFKNNKEFCASSWTSIEVI